MRITNNMILNTSRSNINANKVSMDRLNTQMSTQKKIMKPSDDPIVAVRSLRLRNNISELNQYYEKNIPDAQSWLEVTETSMCNMRDILQDMYDSYTEGANGDLSSTERSALLENLKALSKEFYDEGNTSYAGRRVFTGYKTDTDFNYKEADTAASFNINETFTIGDISATLYTSKCVTIDKTNLTTIGAASMPQQNTIDVYKMTYSGMDNIKSLSYYDASGNVVNIPVTAVNATAAALDNAYMQPASDGANYIKETGELIFGSGVMSTLGSMDAEVVLTANYDKTGFSKGEPRPEMYYDCTDLVNNISYKKETQDIEYQVGFNQMIKVNSEASDILNLDVAKDIANLENILSDVTDAEKKLATLKDMLKDDRYTDPEKVTIQTMYDATEKELDLQKDKLQKTFEAGVGDFQKYQAQVNLQITNEGNRSSRLKLINKRMAQQQTNFEELLTTNEDKDLSDIILEYTASTTAYQAALQATGNINQLSLLNYI